MVAHTLACDEMQALLPLSGQQTAEQRSSVRDTSKQAAVTGLFHTVTASTPRAKRLARVYPHNSNSSSTGVVNTAFWRTRELTPALQLQPSHQGAGDLGREDAHSHPHAATMPQTAHSDIQQQLTQWSHSSNSDMERDGHDDSEPEYWSDDDGENALSLSLTPTRVLQCATSTDSDARTAARRTTLNGPPSSVDNNVLARIATLQALCDQGFLSPDEYTRRKLAIIDALTCAPLLTHSSSSSSSSVATCHALGRFAAASSSSSSSLPLVVPHSPNFTDVNAEAAVKHVFDYATRTWRSVDVLVALDETPFSKGSLRVVYHLLDTSVSASDQSFVAKVAIDPDEDPQTYFRDTELQAHCAYYAQRYNSYNPPKRVEFIEAWVLELTERNGALCAVEPYIPGEYRKHNNNFGSVSDDERNTPQAFSHFTFEASNHSVLAVDIQGVGDLYTDPQIHTRKGDDFGKGNLGVLGFHKFLSSHRCNSICRYLKLPAVNPKDRHADSGTLPVQELMNRDCVRPTQFDSTHYYEHAPMLQKYITQCRALEQRSSRAVSASQRDKLQQQRASSSSWLQHVVASLFCCNGS